MRHRLLRQLPLVPLFDHAHAHDLAAMSTVLDELPNEVLALVQQDLCAAADPDVGRRGLAAEQVVRIAVLKQLTTMSYDRLSFALEDSMSYRGFCRLGPGDGAPSKSTLQQNVKRLSAETLQAIHRAVVRVGFESGVDDGHRVSADSTAIESNIHSPTDSSLLWDCVRRLTGLLRNAAKLVPVEFRDHRRRAKRRALEISNAKSMKQRMPLYRELLKVTSWCLDYARDALSMLAQHGAHSPQKCARLTAALSQYIDVSAKVCSQTWRRVFGGEIVRAEDKIVSICEPHADVIIKDNREPIYGHKAFVTVGKSGMVFDLVVPRGNPNDATLAVELIKRLLHEHGVTPTEAAFDGGFCSHDNLKAIKARGVEAVAFTSPRGLTVEQMTGTRRRFNLLRRFRSAIEGTIGWLKDVFGLRRCNVEGFDSFRAYAWASVLTLNLLVIARHRRR